MVVTKVVVDPSGNVDVIVTGTVVVDRLSDGAGGLAPALVLSVAPAVAVGELESASGLVCRISMSTSGRVGFEGLEHAQPPMWTMRLQRAYP